MNTNFTFDKAVKLSVIVVGVLLVFGLYSVDKSLDRNGRNADGGRALICLQLKSAGQPVEEYAPCMRREVRDLWVDQPVKPVASHEMICQIVDVIQRPIQECEKVADG